MRSLQTSLVVAFGLMLPFGLISPTTPSALAKRVNPNALGAVKAQWTKLMAGGCGVAKANISTPLEARVLRNTVFAIKGKVFKSLELAELFAADGDWYKASNKKPKLDAKEKRCVGKISKWEKRLRKRIAMSPKVEAFMTRDRLLYLQMRRLPYHGKLYGSDKGRLKGGESSWGMADSKECDKDPECGGYTVDCREENGKVSCEMVAVG